MDSTIKKAALYGRSLLHYDGLLSGVSGVGTGFGGFGVGLSGFGVVGAGSLKKYMFAPSFQNMDSLYR
jgi:hypothetical protein